MTATLVHDTTTETGSPAVIVTDKLSKTFSNAGTQQHVLKNLDLEIERGSFTVIMGPSGAGKSTLLYALSGMDRPTLGTVTFDGETISGYSEDALAKFRRAHCGFIFQQIYLLDSLSVMDNVMAVGLLTADRRTIRARADKLFDLVGLTAADRQKFPSMLSGGEAQRVKLAAELQKRSNGRTIYVLDEPTTGLHFEDIRKLLMVLQSLVDKGNSVMTIEHNLDVVKSADWVVDLGPNGGSGGGTIVAEGTPEDIAENKDSFTGQFLAEVLETSATRQAATQR